MKTKWTFFPVLIVLVSITNSKAHETLKLTSPEFKNGGLLPIQFTCEGESLSPPLSWSNVPTGTQSLAVIMDHIPRHKEIKKVEHEKSNRKENPHKVVIGHSQPKKQEALRWYWVVYNIPAHISSIATGQILGKLGNNIVNHRDEYAPPCSNGPGKKSYTFHIYALSKQLDNLQSNTVSASILREKMNGFVLDSDSLTVNFERKQQASSKHSPREK